MKILIIAYYYPPETYATIASLRPYSWAKYWSQAGHEIRILTVAKQRSQTELNPWPNTRIEEVSYHFLKMPSAHKERSSSHHLNSSKLKHYLRQGLLFLQKQLGAGTLLYGSNLWILPAYYHAVKLYKHWKFDFIVSTFPPPASHLVAYLLKRNHNQFWVADYRDLWFGNHFPKNNTLFSHLEKLWESSFIKKANLLTTVSEPLKKSLETRFKLPTVIIQNGFDIDFSLSHRQKEIKNKITLAYTGTLYPERQSLSSLFTALSYLHLELRGRIEILFLSLQGDFIKQLAQKHSALQYINVMGFIPREECLKLQTEVDLLIFLDWNDPNVEGILTGKIFEYMASGTPVINLGCDRQTDASRLIDATGIGVNLGNDPQTIANYLRGLLQGEKPYYQPNYEIIEQYSRKTLAHKMLEQILEHHQLC